MKSFIPDNLSLLFAVITWLVSTLVITGWIMADGQARFPYNWRSKDCKIAWFVGVVMGLTGPLGVVIVLFLTEGARNGWTLRRRKDVR